MNFLMLYEALDQYRLPAGITRLDQEDWQNAGMRSWRTRLQCLTRSGIQSLQVWAWAEDARLHLAVLDEMGVKVLGRPDHDPALAWHELESRTWTDPSSGLMWWREPCFGPFLTDNPFLVLDDIRKDNGIGTFTDWRLPSLDELQTLTSHPAAGTPAALHPCMEDCLADRECHLDLYGHQPWKDSAALVEGLEQPGRWTRIIGYRLPGGICVQPRAEKVQVTISHQSSQPGKSEYSRGVHVLGVRGQRCHGQHDSAASMT